MQAIKTGIKAVVKKRKKYFPNNGLVRGPFSEFLAVITGSTHLLLTQMMGISISFFRRKNNKSAEYPIISVCPIYGRDGRKVLRPFQITYRGAYCQIANNV